MKRYALLLVLLFTASSQVQAEDFWHDSVRACVVGGGVVGSASALLLYSAAASATATATVALPAGTIVIGNTIFGCGLGTIGTMFVYTLGTLYQGMVSQSPVRQMQVQPQQEDVLPEAAPAVQAPEQK